MALPVGITTCTVTIGAPLSVDGAALTVEATIAPTHTIVWAATGERIANFDVVAGSSIELPHVDQAGFLDVAGNAITGWSYHARLTETSASNRRTYLKTFQVLTGQTSVDLDLLPEGGTIAPVGTSTLPAVTSVNGETGAVSVTTASIGAATAAQGATADAAAPAATSPTVFNVRGYGAVGDGTTDDAAAVQAAVTAAIAAGGGLIWFPAGTYLIGATIQVYSAANVIFQGQGTLLNNVTSAPMVRFRNVTYCGTAPTLQWLGQWRGGSSALELDGSLYGDFAVRGDEWPTGIRVVTSVSATQNSAYNDLQMDIRNGVTGMFFEGSGSLYASNNRVSRMTWGGAGSGAPVGINFAKYSDSNRCRWASVDLNVAGSVAVLYNSAAPTSDMQVYENDFDFLIAQGHTSGTVAIKGNRTSSPGRTSFVRLRSAGSVLPTNSIAADSDILLYNSTDGSAATGTMAVVASGTTAQRPILTSAYRGLSYFDTTITKPVWWTGTAWVDSTGTAA